MWMLERLQDGKGRTVGSSLVCDGGKAALIFARELDIGRGIFLKIMKHTILSPMSQCNANRTIR